MIKVSVMYPNTAGARFDHAYYAERHVPLLRRRLGAHCKQHLVERGIAGGSPRSPAVYVAMCHLWFDSLEDYRSGFAPHFGEIAADIPNYTDISPVVQVSEIVVA